MDPFVEDNRAAKRVHLTLGINIAYYFNYSQLNHIEAGKEF
jgi:nitrate reductase gamma subunit